LKHAAFLEDGMHKGICPNAYHAWELIKERPETGPISNSQLKDFVKKGALGWRYSERKKSSNAMAWGSLVDSLLFTPGVEEFVFKEDNPNLSTNGRALSKAAKMWEADQILAEKTIVSESDFHAAEIAVARLKETPASAKILEGGDYQVGLVYTANHGIPTKGLVDVLPHELDSDDCIADLKTTAANLYSDDDLARQCGKFGYHVQAALYLHLYNKITSDYRNRWKIIWQSSSPPYEVRVTELPQEWIDAGKAYIRFHMPRFIRTIKSRQFRSVFSEAETYLPMHSSALYAEENQMDLLSTVEQ
tara:strand:- start:539 stop:1450 length:912 start_codon:yes stop_codon:yes gene_type:complete